MIGFSDFDKLFNSLLREAYDRYYAIENEVDKQGYGKVPALEEKLFKVVKSECGDNGGCCGNCSCTKDINKNEDYATSISTKDYENTPLTSEECNTSVNQLVDECVDLYAGVCTNKCCPDTNNGWWKDSNGNWRTDVYAPVDNQYTEVNILDSERVQVSYEQSYRIDETNMSGYSHQSGSYVFPLPENVNLSTFKAKRSGSYIELSVSPRTTDFDGSCVKVDIQG